MLAKDVMRNGIDIDYRIMESMEQYKIWAELYHFNSGSPAITRMLEDIVENKETEISELIRMKDSLENIIMAINDCDQREILRLRYFDNLPWDCVADHLGEDVEWVKKQHRKALKKIHVECTCYCACDEDDFDADEE